MELGEENARIIEKEFGLPFGAVDAKHERTEAEDIYLSVPKRPMLAMHVDYLSSKPCALIIYDQDIGEMSREYLKGATFANAEEAAKDINRQWAGLLIARQQGTNGTLGEEVECSFTGWVDDGEPGQRWTWSVNPSAIKNLWSGASRRVLLCPKLVDVPPPPPPKGALPDDPPPVSPGKKIEEVATYPVFFVHSLMFKGIHSLRNNDGGGLMRAHVELMEKLKK